MNTEEIDVLTQITPTELLAQHLKVTADEIVRATDANDYNSAQRLIRTADRLLDAIVQIN
ncbi:hypothetical protein [Furfurilactobacillus siliginis]|uniref:Uncharacterized protein n=1 Tax=Furfurilactobacillus siliginis TaxID=348151 RepID=A0A0R2KUY3_9LACO|nr:hypothetical protein [Furfurilactobacillus siliginis]KRN93241.1 hypothetical protein IV55_GL001064 [Furfurilactobacillus siliginis]GEK29643.1 hypothetical protein LSI01_19540 [Furfurilactobacillus siliginis]